MPGEFIARQGLISRGNVVVTGSLSTSGSLTTTGTITATTLVVQTITSSISSITGSTNFGSLLANTHTFTGSLNLTGSLTVNTTGTELQVNANGVNLGNALTDSHVISGSLRVNPNGLFVSSSGNIGIGTSSMSFPLTRSGMTMKALTSDGTEFVMLSSTDTGFLGGALVRNGADFGIVNRTNGSLIFATNAIERMWVSSSGNVGIGTSSPTFLLDLQRSSAGADVALRVQNTAASGVNDASALHLGWSSNLAGYSSIITDRGGRAGTSSAQGSLYFNANQDATERVRMTIRGDSGNVGIGTTSPSNLLHVSGTPASSGILARFQSTATSGSISISHSGNGGSIGYASLGAGTQSNVFYVTTGAGTIGSGILMDNGGTLYINSTSNQLSNATPQLGILAGAATDAVNIKHTQNGNNTVNIWQTGAATFSAIAFYKGDSQILVGSISVTTSNTTYNTTSDYRLKENIVPLENGLDRLMQLKPSKFNWTTTGEETEGFIAHEVQEVFPYAVTGEKDAVYSSTGNIKPQAVDYGRISPLLVKAIQELKAENDSLKLRIEALENK